MKTTATNRKIREILPALQEGTLILKPPFQRRLVWKVKDKRSFIQTILDGFPFPEIFVATGEIDLETGKGTDLLVDGQQRITAIYEYFHGTGDFGSPKLLQKYADLEGDVKEAFLQYDVVVRDLGKLDDPEIRKIFQRINSTSYSLNAMEFRNSRFDGKFKQTAEQIASNKFFNRHEFFAKNEVRRMEDTRFVLIYMTTVMSTYFNLDGEVENFLEEYNENFQEAHKIGNDTEKVFGFVEDCGFDSSSRIWKNRADMFTLLVESYRAIVTHNRSLDHKKIGAKLREFYGLVDETDIDSETHPEAAAYRRATIQGTNNRTSRITRGQYVEAILKD